MARFPFRPETLPVLEWAGKQHHSWKTNYYAALIYWKSNNITKAKALFRKCGSEPDYAPFYVSRGVLFDDDETEKELVLKDFTTAVSIYPKEWRTWNALSNFYESNGSFIKQFDNAKKAYGQFSSNPVISVDYAKALLNNNKPKECIGVLNKTLILPQEGAKEGHEIYEMANLSLALNNIEQRKYSTAIKYLEQAKEYPEKLGEGKPYDPDYRLQDYLLAYCAKQSGDQQRSKQYEQTIIDFSSDEERFSSSGNAASNYIGLLMLDKYGRQKQAAGLVKRWKHVQDSLHTWHISGTSQQMEWVLSKYNHAPINIRALEEGITGNGNISRFTLFLRALQLAEGKNEF